MGGLERDIASGKQPSSEGSKFVVRKVLPDRLSLPDNVPHHSHHSVDKLLSEYHSALQQFLSFDPEATGLTTRSAEAVERIKTADETLGGQIADYNLRLDVLSTKRKKAEQNKSRITSSYLHDRQRGTFKARLYDFLTNLHLRMIAERIYPVQKSLEVRNRVRGEVEETRKTKVMAERNLREEKVAQERQLSEIQSELRRKIEEWVLADRTRVLMYAVEHPERAFSIFYQYTMPSTDSQIVWQSLAQDYASYTGRVLEFPHKLKVACTKQTTLPSNRPLTKQGKIPAEIPTKQESTQEPETKPKLYRIGVIHRVEIHDTLVTSIRELREEEIADYLAKQAEKIAGHDIRMTGDVRNIIDHLRQDPRGLGTRALTRHGSETIDYKDLHWCEFDPRKRPGLKYSHPESRKLRVVYGLIKNGEDGESIIVLRDILQHKEFDRQFGHGRTR